MTRNKVLSSILTIALILASLFLLPRASEAKILPTHQIVQGGASFLKADFATNATHGLITCDGCSGGSNGPG
jgi:hypothetical protein